MRPRREPVRIGVIGGSGFYSLPGLTPEYEVYPSTPWGEPSCSIQVARTVDGTAVAFLARHGRHHSINPSCVNARANIAALKSLGVEVILSFSAVGSLREEIHPRHFVIPNQIIDRTKGIRPSTFFDDGIVGHVSFADPFNAELCAKLATICQATLPNLGLHVDKTVVVMEGPAFSTRAESKLYRAWGGDVINMTALPESKLAREAEIAYAMVCMSTDYDCWKEDEAPVSVESVVQNLGANTANAQALILAAIPVITECAFQMKSVISLRGSNKHTVMTPRHVLSDQNVNKLNFLFGDSAA